MDRSVNHRRLYVVRDLAVVVFCSFVGTILAIVDSQAVLPLRFVLGGFLALFAPGYALISILFPDNQNATDGNPSFGARIVLSIALSAVLVPLVVLGLEYSEIGIYRVPVALSLFVLTVFLIALAVVRRFRLAPESRFSPPSMSLHRENLTNSLSEFDLIDKLLYGGLILAILVTVVGAGYAFVAPAQEGTTEFYLLAENRSGELSASDYPTEFVVNQSESVVVGIENQEGQPETYTVVVQIQRVTERSSSPEVVDATEVSRFTTEVKSGETAQREVTITPRTTGTNQRVLFELYRTESGTTSPYRELYLWVNVTGPSSSQSSALPIVSSNS